MSRCGPAVAQVTLTGYFSSVSCILSHVACARETSRRIKIPNRPELKLFLPRIDRPPPRARKERMLERDTVAAYDYHARDSDELSLRRGEPLVVVAEAEPGWVHVRLPDGREGLVPHNHLLVYQSEGRTAPQLAEAGSDVETLGSEEETDFESLGQSRALPDWGYDHGVRFEGLQPEHPLWLQSALEGFVHALLFNTTAWGLADANVRMKVSCGIFFDSSSASYMPTCATWGVDPEDRARQRCCKRPSASNAHGCSSRPCHGGTRGGQAM